MNNFLRIKYVVFLVILAGLCGMTACGISRKPVVITDGATQVRREIHITKDTVVDILERKSARVGGRLIVIENNEKSLEYGLRLQFINEDKGLVKSTVTDFDGRYSLLLDAGMYRIVLVSPVDQMEVYVPDTMVLEPGEVKILDFEMKQYMLSFSSETIYKNKRAYQKAQRKK